MVTIDKSVIDEMTYRSFPVQLSKGVYTFTNKESQEGILVKDDPDNECVVIESFAFLKGEQVLGEASAEGTVRAVLYLEGVLGISEYECGTHSENAPVSETLPDVKDDDKCRLTQLAIDEHPGTVVALLQLQNTPEQYIKYRKGKGGKRVAYVDGQYMIMGLNYAFKFLWSFDVVDTRREQVTTTNKKGETRTDDMITVDGMLTVWIDDKEIRKTQSGSQIVREGMEVGDATKGANTDAMKKCASAFGIAMDVYSGEWSK